MIWPTEIVPVPVVFCRILGSGGAAASAVGTRLNADFFAGGLRPGTDAGAVICCNSVTFTLLAVKLNCTCGALKLRMVRLPEASVWPIDAVMFCSVAEFCVKRRSALRRFNGWVSEAVRSDAFWTLPVPLNAMAD